MARDARSKLDTMISKTKQALLVMKRARLRMIFAARGRDRYFYKVIFTLGRVLLHCVIIADYQMVGAQFSLYWLLITFKDKLVPHFGKSEQVSFSFFSYHLALSIFRIVNATFGKKCVYIADKLQAGAKSGNHTINYLLQ